MFDRGVEVTKGKEFVNEPKRMAIHRETGIELIVQPEGCKHGEHHEYWFLENGTGLYVDLATGDIRPDVRRMAMVPGLDGVGIENGQPTPGDRQYRLQRRGALPVHPIIGHRPDDPKDVLKWEQTLLEPANIAKFEKHYEARGVKINLDAWKPHVVLSGLLGRIRDEERTNSLTEAARLKEIHAKASARLEALIKSIELMRDPASKRSRS